MDSIIFNVCVQNLLLEETILWVDIFFTSKKWGSVVKC